MRPIGFSTGAIAYSDFRRALRLLSNHRVTCLELSALRWHEVEPLLDAVTTLDLRQYSYIAVHAPSAFTAEQEPVLVSFLHERLPSHWPVVLHPDTIHDISLWRQFGSQLAIENMDRRKPGRTVEELTGIFASLPDATMCFDIGHARQCDPSMTEAYRMLKTFGSRLRQVHVSEVNSLSQHDAISFVTEIAFKQVAELIPENTPLILESRVSEDEIAAEISRALVALPLKASVQCTVDRDSVHDRPVIPAQ